MSQKSPPGEGAGNLKAIVDNQRQRLGDLLRKRIKPGSNLSIVSAYFTIYAYEALRERLDRAGTTRFLYGSPVGVGEVDPNDAGERAFRLIEGGDMEVKNVLVQKATARDCAEWIERQVEIRTIKQANFLHGKLYHVAPDKGPSTALVGSSNFTRRGLGFGTVPNIELNLEVRKKAERQALLEWFDELWSDNRLTRDAKQEVLTALKRLGAAYSPEFVYYKTLFHVLREQWAQFIERRSELQASHLYDTTIWEKLYRFQKDGVINAINRLLSHNGCIIADSVGLGKTWTALAIIKFFELRNEQVLVLCPKRLMGNWRRYLSSLNQIGNPLISDRFDYSVLAHTDLSRTRGMSESVRLENFSWHSFGLVVIDESHNFRNAGKDKTDEQGNLVSRSRYNRLMEEVIKDGGATKVLMLSATPVNTHLRDLRNQIAFMTEQRDDAFGESLGIHSTQEMFRNAEEAFHSWDSQHEQRDKSDLLKTLGADFLSLLDATSIARSRKHLFRFYREEIDELGGFPKRKRPRNLSPKTDLQGEISYKKLHKKLGELKLAIYNPTAYQRAGVEKNDPSDSHLRRKNWESNLIGMMRINLLKRLESSAEAFRLTLERTWQKMDKVNKRLEKWHKNRSGSQTYSVELEEDEEDEDFVEKPSRERSYRFKQIKTKRWQGALKKDMAILKALLKATQRVRPKRDGKLKALEQLLRKKLRKSNRKVLVFTAFSDTAKYLYEQISERAKKWPEGPTEIALITGGDSNNATSGSREFNDLLRRFAPRGQESSLDTEPEIDILISTDCLSEGQNLQDCDLVVNYDIHWNPVRLMQRFGRIDRLNRVNRAIGMVNFWPPEDLNRYLDLKDRIEARMVLMDATATGSDNLLVDTDEEEGEHEETARRELDFRNEQLRRLRDETLDIEEVGDGVAMSDLTLDDFLADLKSYIDQNREKLEKAPFGIYAVVDGGAEKARQGVIFCLKQKVEVTERTPNRLHPYFLIYVLPDGTVRFTFQQAGQTLQLFRELASGHKKVDMVLEDAFDRETNQGRDMEKYSGLLQNAVVSIGREFARAERRELTQSRSAKLSKKAEVPNQEDKFELVTWLVLLDKAQIDDAT